MISIAKDAAHIFTDVDRVNAAKRAPLSSIRLTRVALSTRSGGRHSRILSAVVLSSLIGGNSQVVYSMTVIAACAPSMMTGLVDAVHC